MSEGIVGISMLLLLLGGCNYAMYKVGESNAQNEKICTAACKPYRQLFRDHDGHCVCDVTRIVK